jgi:hypothetical protein
MDFAVGILLGLGLSASCGFRVFVPLLVTNIASMLGYMHFSPGFEWMGGWPAFALFATATVTEISAYYIPWVDNVLDTIAGPLAAAAGTLLTASFITGMNPMIQWTLAIIVGGGSAGIISAGTGVLRLGSSASTGGLGNHIIATIENIVSFVMSVLSLLIPVVMGIFALGMLAFFGIKLAGRKKIKRAAGDKAVPE